MQLVRIALQAIQAIPEGASYGLFDGIRFVGHSEIGSIRPQASQDFILVAAGRSVNQPAVPLCPVKQLTFGIPGPGRASQGPTGGTHI
jgi:hypothetical protein